MRDYVIRNKGKDLFDPKKDIEDFFFNDELKLINLKIKDVAQIILKDCIGCGDCVELCPEEAIPRVFIGYKSLLGEIDKEKCNGCADCVPICPYSAIIMTTK